MLVSFLNNVKVADLLICCAAVVIWRVSKSAFLLPNCNSRLHWDTLLEWTHLCSKIKTQIFGTCGGEMQYFGHMAVHRATCTQSVTLQFIVPRIPNLSHYSSSCHVYPVCHITVHRATYTQSVTLQFIVLRIPSLSHYSSSCHLYPVCHITFISSCLPYLWL